LDAGLCPLGNPLFNGGSRRGARPRRREKGDCPLFQKGDSPLFWRAADGGRRTHPTRDAVFSATRDDVDDPTTCVPGGGEPPRGGDARRPAMDDAPSPGVRTV